MGIGLVGFGLVWFDFDGFLEVAAWFILVLQFPAKDLFFFWKGPQVRY